MDRKKRRVRLIICTLLSLLLCFFVQRSAFNYLEGKKTPFVSPDFLEITMIRLQNVYKLKGRVVILGSSLTERLRSSDEVSVVGVPGSCFLAGLRLLDETAQIPTDATYVLEINNMFNGIYDPVLKDAQQWRFRIFRDSPHFSLGAKPTNLILSYIYYLRMANLLYLTNDCGNGPRHFPVDLTNVGALTDLEKKKWHDLMCGIESIRDRGGRVCMVRYPSRNPNLYAQSYEYACKLARYMDVPILDYNTEYWRNFLDMPDGAHLNSRATSTFLFRNVIARDATHCSR